MNVTRWTGAAVLLATLGTAGCGEATAPSECSSPVTVFASHGTRPMFTWAPRCLALGVQVIETNSRVGIWGTRNSDNTLSPGIEFGGANPLALGISYTVIVEHLVGGDAIERIGEVKFTP